jgi:hypothetical protein
MKLLRRHEIYVRAAATVKLETYFSAQLTCVRNRCCPYGRKFGGARLRESSVQPPSTISRASAPSDTSPGVRREIRLYSNRRLYDTVTRRYVNYRDLTALLEKGEAFTILDWRREVDHTDRILLDLMLQCAAAQPLSNQDTPVTDGFLRELIALGTKFPNATVREFLDLSLRNFTGT